MIRIYFDLNVLTVMKEQGSIFQEIVDTIEKYRDDVLVFYSYSHISDLMRGYDGSNQNTAFIQKDLDYIFEITRGHYFSNYFNDELKPCIRNPHDIFQQALSEPSVDISSKLIDEIISMSNAMPELSKMWKLLGNSFKNMPIGKDFEDALNNPEASELMNTLLPTLKDNPTMGGFFDAFGKVLTNWNTTKDYAKVRRLMQQGLKYNPDKLFGTGANDLKNPFQEMDKLIHKVTNGEKNTNDLLGVDSEYRKHQTKNYTWFDKLVEEYQQLDMFGFRQDKIEVRPHKKKNVFQNILDDGSHAAYASLCDIFVTNDKKHSKPKIEQVYQKNNIKTKLCLPHEFKDTLESMLFKATNLDDFFKYLITCANKEPYAQETFEDGTQRELYRSEQKIFNFFDTILRDENTQLIILGCFRTLAKMEDSPITNELGYLLDYLVRFFGVDNYGKSTLTEQDIEEIKANEWGGRIWILNEYQSLELKFFDAFVLYLIHMKQAE